MEDRPPLPLPKKQKKQSPKRIANEDLILHENQEKCLQMEQITMSDVLWSVRKLKEERGQGQRPAGNEPCVTWEWAEEGAGLLEMQWRARNGGSNCSTFTWMVWPWKGNRESWLDRKSSCFSLKHQWTILFYFIFRTHKHSLVEMPRWIL